MHKQFAVPALEAGYHVLLEKAMEDTIEDCLTIITASRKSGAKLMIAYRLHCEPATVDLINRVRNGELGDLRLFTSIFSQSLKPENHRAQNGFSAGPVPDMGIYCINAARNIFGLEPFEVSAHGYRTPGVDFNCDDTISVTMRFPGEKIATFIVSYTAKSVNSFTLVGTEGYVQCNPAYMFGKGLSINYTEQVKDEQIKTRNFPETDQFAGETEYFSKCIIEGIDPEPDGEEGLRDVRVVDAIKRSLESGKVISLDPVDTRRVHATPDQVFKFKYGKVVKEDDLVNADTPSEK